MLPPAARVASRSSNVVLHVSSHLCARWCYAPTLSAIRAVPAAGQPVIPIPRAAPARALPAALSKARGVVSWKINSAPGQCVLATSGTHGYDGEALVLCEGVGRILTFYWSARNARMLGRLQECNAALSSFLIRLCRCMRSASWFLRAGVRHDARRMMAKSVTRHGCRGQVARTADWVGPRSAPGPGSRVVGAGVGKGRLCASTPPCHKAGLLGELATGSAGGRLSRGPLDEGGEARRTMCEAAFGRCLCTAATSALFRFASIAPSPRCDSRNDPRSAPTR